MKMVKNILILICAFIALVGSKSVEVQPNIKALIIAVDNIEEFKAIHPELEIEELEVNKQPRGTIRYTLGNRISGDRLVAAGGDSKSYGSPQDIQLKLSYPTSGQGASITYVEVIVNQSTNVGRGYIVSGGIGQRQIGIVIEAKSTLYFEYQASIFGR